MLNFDDTPFYFFYYKFVFNNGIEKTFKIKLEPSSLEIIKEEKVEYPDWTLMDEFQCHHCTLDKTKNKHCPIAANLSEVISFFTDTPSYTEANIFLITNERQYYKKASIQIGVSSLIGILMAASGCPYLAYMKPMVRFHLPFSSLEETEFRVLSMFLLAQYFRNKNGKEPDWSIKGIKKIYENIQEVNRNIAKKIANLEKRDTSINSVVVLNNFADFVTFSIDEMDLAHLENLFKVYLD